MKSHGQGRRRRKNLNNPQNKQQSPSQFLPYQLPILVCLLIIYSVNFPKFEKKQTNHYSLFVGLLCCLSSVADKVLTHNRAKVENSDTPRIKGEVLSTADFATPNKRRKTRTIASVPQGMGDMINSTIWFPIEVWKVIVDHMCPNPDDTKWLEKAQDVQHYLPLVRYLKEGKSTGFVNLDTLPSQSSHFVSPMESSLV